MNLFHIQTAVHDIDRRSSFLADNFIGIAWPGTGDLEMHPPSAWKERLVSGYKLEGGELAAAMETLHTFAQVMQDGDRVMIHDGQWIYIGDVGDYYFDDSCGIGEDLICHRRGVTWLGRVSIEETNDKVRALCHSSSILAKFGHPVSQAQLEHMPADAIEKSNDAPSVHVDGATVQSALDILKAALHSDKEELRVRAAAAILQYTKA